MIFVKRFTEAEGKDFSFELVQGDGNITLNVVLPNQATVEILASDAPGIYTSMKKSLEQVGKKTHNLNKYELEDGSKVVATQLLDKYPTEVTFYVKNKKVALKKPSGAPFIPINIDVIPDEEAGKRFPRDIIAIIVPKRTDEGATLEFDPRNLVGKPVIVDAEAYQVVLAIVKWPVWANLKFPVYLSVVDSEGTIGSIQLASKTDNGTARNQIADADNEEALKYLEESKQILEEKMAENRKQRNQNKPANNGGKNNNYGGKKGGYNNNRNTNTKGYGGGGKNFNRNGQK